jgi:hypothetical protein
MPDENPDEQMRKWDALEREAVYVMTDPERYAPIWSVEDLGRELETNDPEAVLRPLQDRAQDLQKRHDPP